MKNRHQSLLKALSISNAKVSKAFGQYMTLINEKGFPKDKAFQFLWKSHSPRVIAYFAIIGLEALSIDVNKKIIEDLERGLSKN